MFLTRAGSRNAFDQTRNSGRAPENMGEFCGQKADDPRFEGQALITCTDNLVHHAGRIEACETEEIPVELCREMIRRRMFDEARLFGHWYVLLFDGTVQEHCRKGHEEGGKRGGKSGARYRYVLQCGLLGPGGSFLPLMHEHIDMHDPVRDKEDCELNGFFRLAQRFKKEFPRLPVCIVGDALFLTMNIADICERYRWKYVLTFREGRQPGLWKEVLALLPLCTENHLRMWVGPQERKSLRDYRWVEDLPFGAHLINVALCGELSATEPDSLYVYATNLRLSPERIDEALIATGRERHQIEDYFNMAKNHGVGLGHVFCANANVSKHLFTLMQVAAILWTIICHGFLRRVHDWAAWATDTALAHAVGEGMRAQRFPATLPHPGQLRFVT